MSLNDCDHGAASINWDFDNIQFDEHQASVQGECPDCGDEFEYVYNEAGIRRKDSNEYVKKF